ncbi:MAG: CRTAC1 family protein [Rhizobiaceae bacterium]|nr:CRTAC1 family protein [Rhizobiaceae bacterium]
MRNFVSFFTALALYSTATLAAETQDVPIMQEQAKQAGVNHTYAGPWEYFVGGGVATFDCNGDRRPDIALAGGTNPAQLFVNKSSTGGALKFEFKSLNLTEKELKKVTGVYPLDINNDGFKDLIFLRVGENLLLKGGPDCSFTKANKEFAFDGGNAWSVAFAATHEEGAEFPTLAIGNYVDRDAPGSPWGTCHDNFLYRPNPGTTINYSNRLALTPGYCALSMIFTDWNKSGTPALRISNDRQYYRGGEEQMWKMEKTPKLYTRADGWQKLTIWGMGIAEADINGDGLPEYALTSMGDTKIQMLDRDADGAPAYLDIAWERGATAHRPYMGGDLKPSTGWHSEFADFNNDGILDLFIAKGNVAEMKDFTANDPDNMLLGQFDGKFKEAGKKAGIGLNTRGRGAAIVDLNMDGMLDLIVVNREVPVSLFANLGGDAPNSPRPMGNWVQIELQQDGPNKNAIGATISIKSGNNNRVRKVGVGGGHASGSLGFIHVGLGVAERANIRVKWPDGSWSAPYRVFANQFVVIKKNDNIPKYWFPQ